MASGTNFSSTTIFYVNNHFLWKDDYRIYLEFVSTLSLISSQDSPPSISPGTDSSSTPGLRSAMPRVYLLSRTLDPFLGIFTGLLAYHLSESNPRTNVQPGHTLRELINWKWNAWNAERRAREVRAGDSADVDWENVTK